MEPEPTLSAVGPKHQYIEDLRVAIAAWGVGKASNNSYEKSFRRGEASTRVASLAGAY